MAKGHRPPVIPTPASSAAPLSGMTGEAPRKLAVVRWSFLFTTFWLMPIAWTLLAPPFSQPLKLTAPTQQTLKANNAALRQYTEHFKKVPADLNHLRAYAQAEHLPFSAYDAYGQRLDYVRLDNAHYVLRSFGDDGIQNTPRGTTDFAIVNWGPKNDRGLAYQPGTQPQLNLFPAVLLEGAESPDGEWTGRVYADVGNQKRQLIVRHRGKSSLFMVAPHDSVEEFLWLPGGRRLVFSATGSVRHRDGLFVWNLEDDSLINLVNLVDTAGAVPLSPAAKAKGLWLSLAGLSREVRDLKDAKTGKDSREPVPVVYAFIAPRHDGMLDPAQFFDPSAAIAFAVPLGRAPQNVIGGKAPTSPLARPLRLDAGLATVRGGMPVQQSWLALNLQGDVERVLLGWHRFSEKEGASPLFPYCLWLLSSLYSESFAVVSAMNGRDADVLRSYGTEIARALLNYPLAPSYLRGLALFTFENLMDGQTLPYRFAQLTTAASVGHARLDEHFGAKAKPSADKASAP